MDMQQNGMGNGLQAEGNYGMMNQQQQMMPQQSFGMPQSYENGYPAAYNQPVQQHGYPVFGA